MIEIKIKFDKCDNREELDQLLGVFFRDKHFHLEVAATEKVSSGGGFHAAIREARSSAKTGHGRQYIELLRRCYPARLTHFSGLKKMGSTWWAAVVELLDPTNIIGVKGMERLKDTHIALLIGWDNERHGSQAQVSVVRNTEDPKGVNNVMAQYETRVQEKEGRRYTMAWQLEPEEEYGDVLDLKPPDELPIIPGLGKPKPRKSATDEAVITKTLPKLKKRTTLPFTTPKTSVSTSSVSVPTEPEKEVSEKEEAKDAVKPKKKKPKKTSKAKAALKEKMRQRRKGSDW